MGEIMKPKYAAVTITGKEIETLIYFFKRTNCLKDRIIIIYGFVKDIIRKSKT